MLKQDDKFLKDVHVNFILILEKYIKRSQTRVINKSNIIIRRTLKTSIYANISIQRRLLTRKQQK